VLCIGFLPIELLLELVSPELFSMAAKKREGEDSLG
jgi:hypothetical protein